MTFQTNQFSYNTESRNYSADASELGIPPGVNPGMVIHLQSARTGKIAKFLLNRMEQNNDGDVMIWGFVNPDLRLSVTIFND